MSETAVPERRVESVVPHRIFNRNIQDIPLRAFLRRPPQDVRTLGASMFEDEFRPTLQADLNWNKRVHRTGSLESIWQCQIDVRANDIYVVDMSPHSQWRYIDPTMTVAITADNIRTVISEDLRTAVAAREANQHDGT